MAATTLRFDLEEVRRVVTHARTAPDHREFYGEQLGPRVMLVKDDGIYLMSNGSPRDMYEGKPDEIGNLSFVAYAKGYHPMNDVDVWEKSRRAVGGDDFSEPIPLDGFEQALATPTLVGIGLRVSANKIDLVVYERVPKKVSA